jgi:mono/diheme cytochrome c family protein
MAPPNVSKRTVRSVARVCAGIAGLVFLIGTAAAGAWYFWRQPESTPAVRGEAVARRLGCFACHGPGGIGGIPDPLSPAGRIPGWDPGTMKLYAGSEEDIRDWILHGKSRNPAYASSPEDPESLAPMPSYAGRLKEDELSDVIAYVKAVSHWAPDIPDDAYEGSVIATRLSCFGCHGPSGMGGIPNPGSFKGHIPPWDGEEFAELVRDEKEMREWIVNGRVERLWNNRAARFFLERQTTQMPAYGGVISKDELDKMAAYVLWLRGAQGREHTAASPIG